MKVNGGWWDKIVIKLKCCEQLGSQVVEIKIYLYNFCFGVESLNYDSMIFLKYFQKNNNNNNNFS